MKKILFALVVAAGLFCLASCKNNAEEVTEVEAVENVDSTAVAVDSVATVAEEVVEEVTE